MTTSLGVSEAAVTGSTTMTVVNVHTWQSGNGDVSGWDETTYIYDYVANGSGAHWNIEGGSYNFPKFSYTPVTGVIWLIKSWDGNKTFLAKSWDYVGNSTTSKHLGYENASYNWLGMMISSICKPGECNAQRRSNVIFTTQTR